MNYSHEVERMCTVAKGPHHGPAPIPEEGKWVKAYDIKDISGLSHGVGWCAPQQGACKLTMNVKDGIVQEALVETLGCSGMTHSAAMAAEILPGKTLLECLNTDLVCDAINVAMREMGFKPYLAPALSSGALSILATLRGEWHYSSQKFGRIFLGAKNRVTEAGIEVENPLLPQELYERIEKAYDGLCLLAEKAEKKKTSDEKAKDKEKEECTVENRTEMERRDYS